MKITATGRNYLGTIVIVTIADETLPRLIARFGSGMDIGDDSAYEAVEFVDAKTVQYFPRQLVARPWSVTVTREFASPAIALGFWMDLKKNTPEQGDVTIEEGNIRRRMLGVMIRLRCPPPRYGVTVKVNYEFLGGDFVV